MINLVEDFKDRFNKALSIRNMRPVELKEKTGISESAISQYRSGYAKPKQDKLFLIANALGVSETWLMGLDVPMEKYPCDFTIVGEDGNSNLLIKQETKAKELYSMYARVSPDVQKAVEMMLRSSLPKP